MPPSVSITANPTSIDAGAAATLTVAANNASAVTITGSDGSSYTLNASGGTQSVSPASTTTYTVSATGKGGNASGTATVSVAAAAPAPTATLAASAKTITNGSSTTLTWTTANATSVTFTPSVGSGTPALSGSATVSPASTTTYTMTATGSGGTATATTTVTVTAPTPTATLTASQSTITSGSSATLTWTSTNATSVSFSPAVVSGTVPLSGSATVNPASTTTYTMTAKGSGETATATATVTVSPSTIGGATNSPIQHLIVLILQNHSFDNLFGTYPGGDGLNPSLPSYTQIDAQGDTVTPELMTQLDAPDINHSSATYIAAWDNGKMDQYAATNGDISMDYYDNTVSGTASDGKTWGIDTIWEYANQYALADHFFSSSMYSEPAQMLYMTAATTHDARTAGSLPYYDKCDAQQIAENGGKGTVAVALTETNVGDQMNAAGVSWVWYQMEYSTSVNGTCENYVPQENPFQYFTTTEYSANLQDFSLTSFEKTLSGGTLPSVVFLTPAPGVSEHPGSGNMADGIEYVDEVVQDVKNSSYWQDTAIVMLYDESGGWYDHEPPPQLANSLGLGARVPVILISPYAKAGYISHQQMDYVSILRFIQWNWGLGMLPSAAQQAREEQSGDLCDLLTTNCGAP